MLKRLIFLFLTILTQTAGFAQQQELDSVLISIDTIDSSENRLQALYNATTHYRDQAPKLNKHFAKYGITESYQLKSSLHQILFNKELGIYYRRQNQLDSALFHYNYALQIAQTAQDSFHLFGIKGSIANVLKAQGNFEEAITNFTEVIAYAEKTKDNRNLVISHINLAALYLTMQQPEKAETLFLNALTIESEVSEIAKPKIYNNLVVVYLELDKIDAALEYANKAEPLIKSKRSLANLSINKGIIYDKQNKYTLARQAYTDALNYYKTLDSETGIIKSYNNLAQLAMGRKDIERAGAYLKASQALIQKSNDISYKNYFYETQVEYYTAKRDYKNALQSTEILSVIKDSLLNIEKQKAISDIEIKYETEKAKREKNIAEKQAAIAQLESSKNRTLFIAAAAIAGLILLASIFFIGRFRARKEAELITIELKETQRRLALEKQYRDSELKALKAQMNPHFIFNALNSIQEYIILNQKDLAGDYLGKFADLMRKYLHHSDAGYITIHEEIESLSMYLELETLRFEESLRYEINLDNNLESEFIKIPTMLIQPYVENALKHGLLHRKENRKLSISFASYDRQTISCTITDNGIGREAANQLKQERSKMHKSFATKANSSRLELLNYRKEQKIGVHITDLKDEEGLATGTKVALTIPILTQ